MKSPFTPLRAVLCATFIGGISLAFATTDAQAQETVVLKGGQQIRCDRVERQGNTLVLFDRRRGAVVVDAKGNEVFGWRSRNETNIGQYSADQLSEATIMRYMPDVWQQGDAQRQGAAPRAGQPFVRPMPDGQGGAALGGGPRIQHSLPGANQPQPQAQPQPAWAPPPAAGAPIAPVVAAVSVPVFNGVKDAGNNVFINALLLQPTTGGFLFEGRLSNVAPLRIYDVRVILHTADMQLMEMHDVATQLEGDNRGTVKFSLPVASADSLLRDAVLVIRCFTQHPSQELRKATYYTFKIERLPTGQYSASPVN